MVFVIDVDHGNQQELINLINNISEKLAQPTTLQDVLHKEAQVDNPILAININGPATQVEQNRHDE